VPAEAEPIGARTYDDLFELTGERHLGIQHGSRRLSVLFGAGYPYAQVYAPPGAGFACLEPMTASTNALVAGDYPGRASRRVVHGAVLDPPRAHPAWGGVTARPSIGAGSYGAATLPAAFCSTAGTPGSAWSSSSSSPQSIRATSVRSRIWGPRLLEK
jgi:hypothetical protein